MPPSCSVVIPTYNRVELLRRTLDSLVAQRLPSSEFEVLVVDDGSTDSTALLVDNYRDRLAVRYFFQPDEGWRVARARNVGISNAEAPVCVFLDSGVVAHTGCLQAHLASHTGGAGPVATSGYVFGFTVDNADSDRMAQALDYDDPDASIEMMQRTGRWTDAREPFYVQYHDDFSQLPAPWVMFWTCNVSAETAQLRAVGGFDEAFQSWGGEDLDLAYRLYLDGASFGVNRAASAIHYPHPKSFEENEAQAAANYRYMAGKYRTPIIDLLPSFGPEINPFTINEVIAERGLPNCRDYLAEHRAS
jgi:glycosyltransferase involved in cell wall biosynthesis